MTAMTSAFRICGLLLLLGAAQASAQVPDSSAPLPDRPRARDIGLVVGVLPPGPRNAITDVAGVRVGQVTVVAGDSIRTGVTAILPHGGNVYRQRVPAAIHVVNGYGKLLGVTQVVELGELETPILLTCTLCVWKAASALVDTLLEMPGMENIRSINPVVGETNDGGLNDIRAQPVTAQAVRQALREASGGAVEEGVVGAGTGTVAFGWKGGIGTASRRLPEHMGGHTVGVLVQANMGGILTMNGAPVGRALDQYAFRDALGKSADGSIMIVVATSAPLDARLLERLARRATVGLSRTGATVSNGSGDYVIAFSTVEGRAGQPLVDNSQMTPLFQAVAEATEEAIYNALLRARTVESRWGRAEALPIEKLTPVLEQHDVLRWDERLPPGRR